MCPRHDCGLINSIFFSAYVFIPDEGLLRVGGRATHHFLPVAQSLSCSWVKLIMKGDQLSGHLHLMPQKL